MAATKAPLPVQLPTCYNKVQQRCRDNVEQLRGGSFLFIKGAVLFFFMERTIKLLFENIKFHTVPTHTKSKEFALLHQLTKAKISMLMGGLGGCHTVEMSVENTRSNSWFIYHDCSIRPMTRWCGS